MAGPQAHGAERSARSASRRSCASASARLSKGYGRRLMLALALITPQPLLLMDEPFDGFDLRQTREIMGVLRDVAGNGRTLVLAIHQLIDAERVCDRFVLLADGRVRGIGTLAELRAQTGMPAGRIGGRLPCAHLTQSPFAALRCAPCSPRSCGRSLSGRALWTMLLILCPLVGYSFLQAVVALRRGKRRGPRLACAGERALAARRRAGARPSARSTSRSRCCFRSSPSEASAAKRNPARCACWCSCPTGCRR